MSLANIFRLIRLAKFSPDKFISGHSVRTGGGSKVSPAGFAAREYLPENSLVTPGLPPNSKPVTPSLPSTLEIPG
jgi:hypothetical protein